MKYLLILFIFSFISCKKNTENTVKPVNDNKLTAQITVFDRTERSFISSGDSTVFTKRIDSYPNRVDSIIGISGDDGIGQLSLILINISSPGTYALQPADTLGTNVSVSFYSEGDILYPTFIASSAYAGASGSFTILKLTNIEIEGTFNIIMKSGEREIIIKNGIFKGKFHN